MAASLSLLPTEKISLEDACARMRLVVKSCVSAEERTMYALFNTLAALEQVALNAPQNSGRLRTLQYELLDDLKRFSKASNAIATDLQLQAAFSEIVCIIRKPEIVRSRNKGELMGIGRLLTY